MGPVSEHVQYKSQNRRCHGGYTWNIVFQETADQARNNRGNRSPKLTHPCSGMSKAAVRFLLRRGRFTRAAWARASAILSTG